MLNHTLRYAARWPAAARKGFFLCLPGTCSSARVARLGGHTGLLPTVPGGTGGWRCTDFSVRRLRVNYIFSYFFFARLRLAGRPPGLGWNFSTSERRSNVFPAIMKVVNRPLATRLDIAWRLIPLIRAASDCETQSAGFKDGDFDKLVDNVHYNRLMYLCRYSRGSIQRDMPVIETPTGP